MFGVVAGNKRVPKGSTLDIGMDIVGRVCCLCWTWQGAQTPFDHDVGQEQASLAGGYPSGLRERHGDMGGLASSPQPLSAAGSPEISRQ